ncbi:hypothetical protein SAY87_015832 [Trapa incisa]|uniref:P-type ATPase C-terminal domain-containing protein n=1 Tax=Trapa incisa TaxID=236973 RepID=A0AAN7L5U3_9MYRT|nr:hypothetical protein SAY87_015832 [Trapa incisa]
MEFEEQQYPLSPQQLLLRDSKLRNTDYVYGAVIFTGQDTKVRQNSTDPLSKRSRIERKMDRIIYLLFFILFLLAFIGSIIFGVETKDDLKNGTMKRWYLRPDDSTDFFNPKDAPLAAIYHFLTAIMLFSYFIPISLYVSIEIIKALQSMFINRDIRMYYEEADKPADARTSNLNEELGQSKDLILLGATAVEDKLQNGVPDCIDKLAQAGIKIWVLTGDKMETEINIGFACSLLRQGMKQIIIGLDAPEIQALEKAGDKSSISKAVMSSDIAIAQFQYLDRLLLVHGHWCYRRIITMICYFLYKNIVFGFSLFFYEIYASFSGQPVYNDWFLSLYNVFFTSLQAIALGVFDQDVSARFCLKNVLFSWFRILSWMFSGFLSAVIIFFFCIKALEHQAFNSDGKVVGLEILGGTMYTCIVWVVNLQMAISISYFTLIQHAFIWGSIGIWYLFLVVYGAISPSFSTTAYKVFMEALAPAPSYWLWIRHEGQSDDVEYCKMVRQRSLRPTTVGHSARLVAKRAVRKMHEQDMSDHRG